MGHISEGKGKLSEPPRSDGRRLDKVTTSFFVTKEKDHNKGGRRLSLNWRIQERRLKARWWGRGGQVRKLL